MLKVLVTGGTGYLGSWVVKYLLERGYDVKLPVRDKSNTVKYNYLFEIAAKSKGSLTIFSGNLLEEKSYDQAMKNCEYVFHVASPFLIKSKDAKKEIIDPAVKGTQNVLDSVNRTSSVKRVILTSSVAAVYGDNVDMKEQNLESFNESHFNKSSSIAHQPYSYSKSMAEKLAWDISKEQARWNLVVINPSFILGPVLSKTSRSESIKFMRDILKGRFYFGAPAFIISYVDVRDVALAHIRAAENTSTEGRYIISNKSYNMIQVAKIIKDLFGDKFKLPKYESPKWLIFLLGPLFGVTRKFVRRNIGYPLFLDNKKSKDKLGVEYTSIKETIDEMVKSITK